MENERKIKKESESKIAIIGMDCTFPGASNYGEFWETIIDGSYHIKEVSESRWSASKYYSQDRLTPDTSVTVSAGFINEINCFDAKLFKYTAKEASLMDPQQKMLLQTAWKCIEDSGQSSVNLRGKSIGVFVGFCNLDHKEKMEKNSDNIDFFQMTGSYASILSNRVSHYFDFKGPSISVDTACSSSLVAINLAINSLKTGESKQAIAGGVSLLLSPTYFIALSHGGLLSKTSSCRTFDASANGYVRGEGCGLILLKPLEDAIANGDNIHAVIAGGAVNHGGYAPTITSPNAFAQSQLIFDVYQKAGISPDQIGLIEAHGTGTPKGDPIEFSALCRAFRKLSEHFGVKLDQHYCGIGSVKSNIGHLEAAAGIAGVIKAVLSVKNKKLPKTICYELPNRRLKLEGSPFFVLEELKDWKLGKDQKVRIAGVSSFGFGGANAHIAIQEYTDSSALQTRNNYNDIKIVVLSAESREQLVRYAKKLAFCCETKYESGSNLGDVSYTSIFCRVQFPFRLAILSSSVPELLDRLNQYILGEQHNNISAGRADQKQADELVKVQSSAEYDRAELKKLASDWTNGRKVDWEVFKGREKYIKVLFPTYPFNKSIHLPKLPNNWQDNEVPQSLDCFRHSVVATQQPLSMAARKISNNNKSDNLRRRLLLKNIVNTVELSGIEQRLVGCGEQFEECLLKRILQNLISANIVDDELNILTRISSIKFEKWLNHLIVFAKNNKTSGFGLNNDWELTIRKLAADPNLKHRAKLADSVINNLPKIITGERYPTDFIFPNGDMTLVGNVYKNNPVSDYFNNAVSLATEKYIKTIIETDPYKKFHILEIGAGTGGTTASVVRKLDGFRENIDRYVYSDVSTSFLNFGRKNYGEGRDYLETKYLDIEDTKTFSNLGEFDVIIATNVIHATSNITHTLNNISGLLAQDGVFLLNELIRNNIFYHSTFGLLDGWWQFEDDKIRIKGSPLLTQELWVSELKKRGLFCEIFPKESLPHYDQRIIVSAHSGNVAALYNTDIRENISDYCVMTEPDIASTVQGTLMEIVGELIAEDLDNIPVDKPFVELGIDSITVLNFAGKVQATLSVEITPVEIFDNFNIDLLSKFIGSRTKDFVTTEGTQDTIVEEPTNASCRSKYDTKEYVRILKSIISKETEEIESLIDENATFLDLGVDSILAVPIINQINKAFATNFSPVIIFDHENVRKLSEFISDNLGGKALPVTECNAKEMAVDLNGKGQIGSICKNDIGMEIKEIVEDCTGELILDEDFLAPLQELGVDSILALRVIEKLNSRYSTDYLPSILFDYKNISELSDFISDSISAHKDDEDNSAESRRRVIDNDTKSIKTSKKSESPSASESEKYWIEIEGPGTYFVAKEYASKPVALNEGEILVSVTNSSINFGDLLCVTGLYPTMPPYPFTPGFEVSGVVLKANCVEGNVQRGDRVMALLGANLGGHSSTVVCNEHLVRKIPQHITFQEAACIPAVALTAVEIFERVRCKAGDWILIHTATSGLGLMLLDISKHLDLNIITTVGRDNKFQYLKSKGVSHVINYVDENFERVVNRITEGKGVDILVNTLTEESIQMGLRCIAADGYYVEVAMTALISAKAIDISCLNNNQSFISIDLRRKLLSNPRGLKPLWDQVEKYLAARVINSIEIYKEFDISDGAKAFKEAGRRERIGKVVIAYPQLAEKDTFREKPLIKEAEGGVENQPPIAIIGMSTRFADKKNYDEFWESLLNGESLISNVKRWPIAKFEKATSTYCTHGSMLQNFDMFDPEFFNISGTEALYMDPQQRVFLEESWNALEDAGYAGNSGDPKNWGVFLGCSASDYFDLVEDEYPAQAFWGNAASITASRISYLMNLTGPAITVDTACSSSLVALELAFKDLRHESIDIAIVGGSFVQSTNKFYNKCNNAGMLSNSGRCSTFDERADGFVPGEGTVCLVLKLLDRATHDKDNIHALIKGVASNQDGTTNGITAPSGKSQISLMTKAYEEFGIDSNEVSYIEAHGTGTKLGDPIEFNALNKMFGPPIQGTPKCAIGSVKSNIGHTATTAGLAGVAKVILMLKNGTIAPSINFREMNPLLESKNTRFFVPPESMTWESYQNKPRLAVVSSFGFSGTNAHAILEEYCDNNSSKLSKQFEYPICFSARNEAALKQQAKNIRQYLDENRNTNLRDLSFTLLVGRGHFEYRFGIVTDSVGDLISRLDEVIGKELVENRMKYIADGRVSAKIKFEPKNSGNKENLARIMIERYLNDINLSDVFSEIYSDGPNRLSLPTYPYQRQRYWLTNTKETVDPGGVKSISPYLVPKASGHTIGTGESCCEFDGNEEFFVDHVVAGKKILPGVCYLVIVQEAVAKLFQRDAIITFKNIIWLRQYEADRDETCLFVNINKINVDSGDFIITKECNSQENSVYCKGEFVLDTVIEEKYHDLKYLRSSINTKIYSKEEFYEYTKGVGLDFGPTHQGIESIQSSSDQKVLAFAKLPIKRYSDNHCYQFNPVLLDCSLQSLIALQFNNGSAGSLEIPFSVDEVTFRHPFPEKIVVYVHPSGSGEPLDNPNRKSLSILNEDGKELAKFKGVHLRTARFDILEDAKPRRGAFYRTGWSPTVDLTKFKRNIREKTLVLIGDELDRKQIAAGFKDITFENIDVGVDALKSIFKNNPSIANILWLPNPSRYSSKEPLNIELDSNRSTIKLFVFYKLLVSCGYTSKSLNLVVFSWQTLSVFDENIYPSQAGVLGLAGSIGKECPSWNSKAIDLSLSYLDSPEITEIMTYAVSIGKRDFSGAVAIRNNLVFKRELTKCEIESVANVTAYKNNGIYIIFGGAGGLGQIFTSMLIKQYNATVIWVGRRDIDESIQAAIRSAGQNGNDPIYCHLDYSNNNSFSNICKNTIKKYGQLNGIIHSAIVLNDRSILNMNRDDFLSSYNAKLKSGIQIATALHSSNVNLDFLVFFSSLQSYLTAPGQCNYAAGCTFTDSLAMDLSKSLNTTTKIINWGFWGDVGIVANEMYKNKMEALGLDSINEEDGTQAINKLLLSEFTQLTFACVHDEDKLMQHIPISEEKYQTDLIGAICKNANLKNVNDSFHLENQQQIIDVEKRIAKYRLTSIKNVLELMGIRGAQDVDSYVMIKPHHKRWLKKIFEYIDEIFVGEYSLDNSLSMGEAKDLVSEKNTFARNRMFSHVLLNLENILLGKQNVAEVLFPNGSQLLVEDIYNHNKQSDYCNELVAGAVVSYLDEIGRSEVRILEIGAGTGSTSAIVLSKLSKHNIVVERYCFTDMSKYFAGSAYEKLKSNNSFLEFHLLDIETLDGVKTEWRNYFDVVIATNVLHATSDIGKTIENINELTKEGGMLVVNELTRDDSFAHIVFGLTDGWWRFSDPDLRIAGTPLLTDRKWPKILAENGFLDGQSVTTLTDFFGQSVIIAICAEKVSHRYDPKTNFAPKKSSERKGVAQIRLQKDTEKEPIRETIENFILDVFGRLLLVEKKSLLGDKPLSAYGMDSILTVSVTDELKKNYPFITTTDLYENSTINSLVDFVYEKIEMEDFANAGSAYVDQEKKHQKTFVSVDEKTVLEPRNKDESAEEETALNDGNGFSGLAIIGISCRLPGSNDAMEFWENLKNGVNSIDVIPDSRWNWRDYISSDQAEGKHYTKWGGFIEDVEKFDAEHFQLTPSQAEKIDPQERLFLEASHFAIEDAGYTPSTLECEGEVGVYVGVMNCDYKIVPNHWSIANRISYSFDFHGPSLAVDTACSSSLTALHIANNEIRFGAIDTAIIGGVNVISHPQHFINLCSANMLSAENKCKAFSSNADGFVDSEGIGTLVVRNYDVAKRRGDNIYAVIKSTSANSGGRTQGYTVPNPKYQRKAIEQAIHESGVDPRTINYIEAHGTGTELGDPIEIAGITQAFNNLIDKCDSELFSCRVGSVKSNIGHCESAAGVAGLIKVVLQLRHQTLVPSLHCQNLNSKLEIPLNFAIQQKLEKWERPSIVENGIIKAEKRAAGISSFGAGGANCHVILQEELPPELGSSIVRRENQEFMFCLSVSNKQQLSPYCENILRSIYFRGYNDSDLRNISMTLNLGRALNDHRVVIICRNIEKLCADLEMLAREEVGSNTVISKLTKNYETNITAFEKAEVDTQVIEGGELIKVAEDWINGESINWSRVYKNLNFKRLSVGNCPLSGRSFWAPEVDSVNKKTTQDKNLTSKQGLRSLQESAKGELYLISPELSEAVIGEKKYLYSNRILIDIGTSGHKSLTFGKVVDSHFFRAIDHYHPVEEEFVDSYEEVSNTLRVVFSKVVKIVKKYSKENSFLQIVVNGTHKNTELLKSFAVLLNTVRLENSKFLVQMLFFENGISEKERQQIWQVESANPYSTYVEYSSDKQRKCLKFNMKKLSYASKYESLGFLSDNEIHVLIGGGGGVGLVIAKAILTKTPRAKIIIVGRSSEDEKTQKLSAFFGHDEFRTQVIYRKTDIRSFPQVKNLIDSLYKQFGKIDCLYFLPAVSHDTYLINAELENSYNVLDTKITGVNNIDLSIGDRPIHQILLFSSLASLGGNIGQGNYAFANSYLNAFSRSRNLKMVIGERTGKTISICWPHWDQGGMAVDLETEHRLYQYGLMSINNDQAIALLGAVAETSSDYVGVALSQDKNLALETFNNFFHNETAPDLNGTLAFSNNCEIKSESGYGRKFVELFCDATKISIDELDYNKSFSDFGIDSIQITKMNKAIETELGDISKTLFYEFENVKEIRDHLDSLTPTRKDFGPPDRDQHELVDNSSAFDQVAIIGHSARYPRASSLEEFWENLSAGNSSISEIPKNRWSLVDHYLAGRDEAVSQGKSYSKWGGFLEGFDEFDNLFFNISPREASTIDPQERIFLQSCWTALEDAGVVLKNKYRDQNNIGVYAGITKTGYNLYSSEIEQKIGNDLPFTSFASLSNRVSYNFNLSGPSITFDTMCSSSLVAIHNACKDLNTFECEIAVAGAVNLYLHPSNYASLCRYSMLASDEKCKAFGKGGDGFVPGEGVGVVVLKRLQDAIRCRDNIQGVIIGSHVNHGGKTNSYTVPNPNAQAALIAKTIKKAGIWPEQISYIEAHGTGTELGDPIEITGLSGAFKEFYDDHDGSYLKLIADRVCSVGSVKSNIGHLEAAAGIAGLSKILLQLKFKSLTPSLHSSELNPNIDFKKTPFRVQRIFENWSSPRCAKNRYPNNRIAGLSSFGAGGTNAHLLVREFLQEEFAKPDSEEVAPILVVSAKSKDQLIALLSKYIDYFQAEFICDSDINRMFYTSQIGREHFEFRAAFTGGNVSEIAKSITEYIQHSTEHSTEHSTSPPQENLKELDIKSILENEEYESLCALWSGGLEINWNKIYRNDNIASKIGLPTCQFLKTKYWFPEHRVKRSKNDTSEPCSENEHSFHIAEKTSFFRDHKIDKNNVIPGAVYVEWTRSFFEERKSANETLILNDVSWQEPITSATDEITIRCMDPNLANKRNLKLEISTKTVNFRALCHIRESDTNYTFEMNDIISNKSTQIISAEQCYEKFGEYGLRYGDSLRSIDKMFLLGSRVLVKLKNRSNDFVVLNSKKDSSSKSNYLSPSILDGALQSPIGFLFPDFGNPIQEIFGTGKIFIPYRANRIEIIRGANEEGMYALVHGFSENAQSSQFPIMDIDVLDAEGNVCVKIKSLAFRVTNKFRVKHSNNGEPDQPLYFTKNYADLPNNFEGDKVEDLVSDDPYGLLLIGPTDDTYSEIPLIANATQVEYVPKYLTNFYADDFEGSDISERFVSSLKCLCNEDSFSRVYVIIITPDESPEVSIFEPLVSLVNTVAEETKQKYFKTLCYNQSYFRNENISIDNKEFLSNERNVRIASGTMQTAVRNQVFPKDIEKLDFKSNSGYIITGASGALAKALALDISKETDNAKLLLISRSEIDDPSFISEVNANGATIKHLLADIADSQTVITAVDLWAKEVRFISGVFHTAGVSENSRFMDLSSEIVNQTIRGKVHGAHVIDRATSRFDLDFFVLYSSLCSEIPNPGQSIYAYANGMLDSFAHFREKLVVNRKRKGKTLSIAWPHWLEGGMPLRQSVSESAFALYGAKSIPLGAGANTLKLLLGSSYTCVAVAYGNLEKLRKSFLNSGQQTSNIVTTTKTLHNRSVRSTSKKTKIDLGDLFCEWLITTISEVLNLELEKLGRNDSLSGFGLDSILVLDLNRRLTELVSDVPKTLFLEHDTVALVCSNLLESHYDEVQSYFSQQLSTEPVNSNALETVVIEDSALEVEEVATPTIQTRPNQDIHTGKGLDLNPLSENDRFIDVDSLIRFGEVKYNSVCNPSLQTKPISIRPSYEAVHQDSIEARSDILALIKTEDSLKKPVGYERLLYVNIFVSWTHKKYSRISIDNESKMIVPVLPIENELHEELRLFSQDLGYKLLLVDVDGGQYQESEYQCIPIGIVQDINISKFGISGSKMRKLRYLVEKFRKSGEPEICEIKELDEPQMKSVSLIMQQWAKFKGNVIRHSFVCMKDVLSNELPKGHRAYLTTLNGIIQSVIVIAEHHEGEFLMDQEFYDPEIAQLGHMEFSIVKIIEALKNEGARIFSLGATWYPFPFIESSGVEDKSARWIRSAYSTSGFLKKVFDLGQKNYQFKKKFLPALRPINAYLDIDENPNLIFGYWPIFYENSLLSNVISSELGRLIKPNSKEDIKIIDVSLESQIESNFISDSWGVVKNSECIKKEKSLKKYLKNHSRSSIKHSENSATQIFNFKHIFFTSSGKDAEAIFYRNFECDSKRLVTPLQWTSTLMSQLNSGFEVIEIPSKKVFDNTYIGFERSEICLISLREQLVKYSGDISGVCLEASNNASGGFPVSPEHVDEIRELIEPYKIPLILDSSRLIRNMFLLNKSRQSDKDFIGAAPAFLSRFDYVVGSLTKDFLLPFGGVIATDDELLANKILADNISRDLLADSDTEVMIQRALSQTQVIASFVERQSVYMEEFVAGIKDCNFTLIGPKGGHAVLFDLNPFIENGVIKNAEEFVERLLSETGIKVSIHQTGKSRNTDLSKCVRLAMPLGTQRKQILVVIKKFKAFVELMAEVNTI